MNTSVPWEVRWLSSICDVECEQWDRLALPLSTPLLEYQWLRNLEVSGSIAPVSGWQPNHLTIWNNNELIGAAPMYLKSHSGGEFVFDQWWEQLASEYGIDYFPKLVGMSPATPSVGYQFLFANGIDHASVTRAMLSAIDDFCEQHTISGCHLHFVNKAGFAQLSSDLFTGWLHQSYLWKNQNFTTFNDYLKIFKSSQRRNIQRECRSMGKHDIKIRTLTGKAITTELAPLMYRYYLKTNEQYGSWAARFLNGNFFEQTFQNYRHRLLIIAAYQHKSTRPVALSMSLVKDRHLIGRYWGCETPLKDLHFNMCYYAPINWAIENGIQTFDPGAGSPHKLKRGFAAVSNTSLHRFYNPHLKYIFNQLIEEVNTREQSHIDQLNTLLPFARNLQ